MGKKLEYLVIHCTATPAGREVYSDEIRRWHTAPVSAGGRGWKQVGYSVLFHLNGGVEQLVPNNDDDVVDPWEVTNGAAGYNSRSMHICYVGGVDSSGTPRDTRTADQRRSMGRWIRRFRTSHPDVRIVGHHDLNPGKSCPSFDVREWLRGLGV